MQRKVQAQMISLVTSTKHFKKNVNYLQTLPKHRRGNASQLILCSHNYPIPKPEKTSQENYRPESLMNMDAKLSKPVNQLQQHIKNYMP